MEAIVSIAIQPNGRAYHLRSFLSVGIQKLRVSRVLLRVVDFSFHSWLVFSPLALAMVVFSALCYLFSVSTF